jgi:hypothetical protein
MKLSVLVTSSVISFLIRSQLSISFVTDGLRYDLQFRRFYFFYIEKALGSAYLLLFPIIGVFRFSAYESTIIRVFTSNRSKNPSVMANFGSRFLR